VPLQPYRRRCIPTQACETRRQNCLIGGSIPFTIALTPPVDSIYTIRDPIDLAGRLVNRLPRTLCSDAGPFGGRARIGGDLFRPFGTAPRMLCLHGGVL
jgi:hypothetical protein